MLFPFGTVGFSDNIPHYRASRRGRFGTVSIREFYAYRLSYRLKAKSIFKCSKLFQQYMVDAYVKVERDRLNYIEANQHIFRTNSYHGLMDYLRTVADNEDTSIGSIYILPSTFVGSERYMRQAFSDAMAIVRKFGKPCLFITFTANPNWPEIKEELGRQPHTSRPDICDRVFFAKFKELMDDLVKKQVLGATDAHVAMIEFQKRGLAHAHILLFMKNQDKVTTAESVDQLIWAELPDPDIHPELFELVLEFMIHECDYRCLDEKGKCTRHFPKPYSEETIVLDNKITKYKRRRSEEGANAVIKNGKVVDNRRVIPYPPYLLPKYKCHLNIEWCSSVDNVKYVCKYIFKGHDLGKVIIEKVGDNEVLHYNEIKHYVNGRFVSSFEAFWRIYELDLHDFSHSVEHLQIHEPNMQRILVPANAEETEVREACERDSMLMAFFRLNQEDPEAREHLYADIPLHYWFDKSNRQWVKRVRNVLHKKLARLYNVNPKNLNLFCIRVLLMHVRGKL